MKLCLVFIEFAGSIFWQVFCEKYGYVDENSFKKG